MRFFSSILALWVVSLYEFNGSFAFAPVLTNKRASVKKIIRFASSNANEGETEVEQLLRRARELKAEADTQEQALRESRLNKKFKTDGETDAIIDNLFPIGERISVVELSTTLKENMWSTDKMLRIAGRLHEREVDAKGIEHVVSTIENDKTIYTRVEKVDEEDLERVTGLIDRIIEAADMIDEEYLKAKRDNKDTAHRTHIERAHWTVGESAEFLKSKVKHMRREHEQQFKDRQNSFYEAQRKKDIPRP